MLKTRARLLHKDQAMSQSMDLVGQNNNNNNIKPSTNPLALSLLIGLNNNNKCIPDSDFVRSPRSPLEFRVLSSVAEPFFLRSSLITHLNCCCGPTKVGLSLVDSLGDDRVLAPDVVFGPALRIKCSEEKHPKMFPETKIETEKERPCVVFEIVENSPETEHIRSKNRSCLRKTAVLSGSKLGAEGDFHETDSDIEMSEDYTCVIAHGPNPKTTHIYCDRVLECHKDELKEEDDHKEKLDSAFPLHNFLTVCNFCNKKLEVGEDIYMYRGDKAFCSEECRSEEMMIDEEENLDDSSLKKLF